MGNTHIIRR